MYITVKKKTNTHLENSLSKQNQFSHTIKLNLADLTRLT